MPQTSDIINMSYSGLPSACPSDSRPSRTLKPLALRFCLWSMLPSRLETRRIDSSIMGPPCVTVSTTRHSRHSSWSDKHSLLDGDANKHRQVALWRRISLQTLDPSGLLTYLLTYLTSKQLGFWLRLRLNGASRADVLCPQPRHHVFLTALYNVTE